MIEKRILIILTILSVLLCSLFYMLPVIVNLLHVEGRNISINFIFIGIILSIILVIYSLIKKKRTKERFYKRIYLSNILNLIIFILFFVANIYFDKKRQIQVRDKWINSGDTIIIKNE